MRCRTWHLRAAGATGVWIIIQCFASATRSGKSNTMEASIVEVLNKRFHGHANCCFVKHIWLVIIMLLALLLLGGTVANAMEAENGKGIMGKLPVFTGHKDAFVMWMAKFMAVATMGYYIEAVSFNETTKVWGEPDCPKTMAEATALNSGVPADKLKIDMWK
jgi:hypothetical protein